MCELDCRLTHIREVTCDCRVEATYALGIRSYLPLCQTYSLSFPVYKPPSAWALSGTSDSNLISFGSLIEVTDPKRNVAVFAPVQNLARILPIGLSNPSFPVTNRRSPL